jgi:hypothetical protein
LPATSGPTGDRQERTLLLALIRQDIAGYLSGSLPAHLILLLPPAVVLAAWFGRTASPVVPVMIILFSGLEPRFNNILFNTKNEFFAFSVLPVPWSLVVRARNCSTLILTVSVVIPLTFIVLFFSPRELSWGDALDGLLYLASVLPPLLHFGNIQSVRSPRPLCGLRMNDVAELLWMMANVALASLPYFILCEMTDLDAVCLVYAIAWFIFWWKRSAPGTAERILERMDILIGAS